MNGDLQVRKVVKTVRGTTVLDGVDLTVRPGRVHALLGPNGSGKTTTLRALLGLCRTDSGEILLAGSPLEQRRRHGTRIAACLDRLAAERGARVSDVVRLYAASRPHSEAIRRRVHASATIGSLRRRRVGELSYGQRQLLSLCLALATDADVYLLDEPFNGLDVFTKLWAVGEVRGLARRGACVLVTSHTLDGFEEVVEDVTLLHGGTTRFAGTKTEMLRAAGAADLLVRTSDDERALARLSAAGHTVRRDRRGLLVAAGSTDEVGQALSTAGVVVLELSRRDLSLQDAFVDLVRAPGHGHEHEGAG